MHGSFLFVTVGLVGEIVKCQDRIFRREDASHQSCPVEFVPIRAFFDIIDECLGSSKNPFTRMATHKEFAGYPMNSLMYIQAIERNCSRRRRFRGEICLFLL